MVDRALSPGIRTGLHECAAKRSHLELVIVSADFQLAAVTLAFAVLRIPAFPVIHHVFNPCGVERDTLAKQSESAQIKHIQLDLDLADSQRISQSERRRLGEVNSPLLGSALGLFVDQIKCDSFGRRQFG